MFNLPRPKHDGLHVGDVGDWARDKHYFLRRYIDAFTTAMRPKTPTKWSSLHYIDLFAGPGIVKLRESGELEWGSPLIAAQAPNSFDTLHFCDRDEQCHRALTARVDRLGLANKCRVLLGDANERVREIVDDIPSRSLSLAFLDPHGLHLNFDTLKVLAAKRVDLIVFFPDHLDVLRNCEYVYHDDPSSNLDRCLGPGVNWRVNLENTPKDKWAEVLRKLYTTQIAGLGYKEFEYVRVERSPGHPLYLLIFCSRHPLAARLWRRIGEKRPDGQRSFDFGAP